MYKVITISKENGQEQGYLGEYETEEEAVDIANGFNKKSDRHPSIAKVIEIEDDNYINDFYSNPNQVDEEDSESESEQAEDFEWEFESESESESEEEQYDLSFFDKEEEHKQEIEDKQNFIREQQQRRQNYPPKRPISRQIRDLSRANPIEQEPIKKTPLYTSLVSQQSTERIKSLNKHEMKYNKDRFMFRDVGSSSSLTSMRKNSTNPFMFQGQIEYSIQGIIINSNKVLIREPSNHHDGVKWEFYGGTPSNIDQSETETLIREVKEETGYMTSLVTHIEDYTFNNKILKFYLLKKISKQEQWKDYSTPQEETWSTKWVTKEQAWNYFNQNLNHKYKRILRNALDEAFHKYKLLNMRY